MKMFILMTQLMTRIPLPLNIEVKNIELGKGNVYFPLIGVVIGGFLSLVTLILKPLLGRGFLLSILVVASYIWVSGGLHLDGLSDTFDGLGSNRSKERILEIMKDSRVGVFGVLVLMMTILLQIASIFELNFDWHWLLLMPMLGRYACVFCNTIARYARTDGMGKYFVENCGYQQFFFASFYTIPFTLYLKGLQGFLTIVLILVFTLLFTRWVEHKIDGITGDVIGATIELNQLLVLLLAVLFNNLL